VIEPEKPKKVVAFPLQTGRTFKISEPKASAPLASPVAPSAKKSSILKKKSLELPSRVARALKLVDEEDLDVEQHAEAALRPVPQVEESEVEVIEAPLVRKRKLKKVEEPAVPVIEPAALVVEPAASVVEAVNVANFLATRRK
jgi:hypothetical protein